MHDNSVIVQILIIFMVLIVVGGNLGLTLQGEIGMPDYTDVPPQDRPGAIVIDIPFVDEEEEPLYVSPSLRDENSFLSWLWRGLAFFVMMILFQVPGMPAWISAIFMAMTLMMLFIAMKWARGTSGA